MKKVIVIAIFLFIVGILLFGRLPDEVGFPQGFVWQLFENDKVPVKDIPSNVPPSSIYAKDAIKILDVSPRRSIYSFGELAIIDINLDNPYNYDYNLSVYWILNDSWYLGWNTQDKLNKTLSSWIILNQKGDWTANVVVKWEYKNQTFDTDKNTIMKVI